MAVTNWIQFGILCALLTGGYGEDCYGCLIPGSHPHSLDNIACHYGTAVVIKIRVTSESKKNVTWFRPQPNWLYNEVEVLKSYKCDGYEGLPAICTSPLPKIAKVTTDPTADCPSMKLENGELYLMTGYFGHIKVWQDNIPDMLYDGCNFVKKWSCVESDEQNIIDQAAKCPKLLDYGVLPDY